MKERKGPFTILLIAMIVLVLVQPVLSNLVSHQILVDLLFSIIFIAIFLGLSEYNWGFKLVLIPGVLGLLARWSWYLTGEVSLVIVGGHVFNFLFLCGTAFIIVFHVLSAKRVTYDTISSAVAAYFLIGFAFANVFSSLEFVSPGSFHLPGAAGIQLTAISSTRFFVYYSFVSLTTLGFGDATPVSDIARSLTIIEAIAGQMFVAILIARLVGISSAQKET